MRILLCFVLSLSILFGQNPIPRSGAVGPAVAGDVTALWSGCTSPSTKALFADGTCQVAVTAQQRSITFVIDGGGSPITTGALSLFPTAAYSCTINRIDVSSDVSGSITVDIWKAAGAIPTAGNKISASAPATLSSAQLSQNGSLTGWTTAVTSGDVFGGTIVTASTVTRVMIQIWCQ